MTKDSQTVRLYYYPQSFPCGPQSSCCGPVGTSGEELAGYVRELESGLPGVRVEAIDASGKLNMGRDLAVIKLLNTFGAAACPIFAVHGEVVSMGPPALDELATLLGEKLRTAARA